MKNLILTFMVAAICAVTVNGQVSQKIKYQTIIRDASGEIIANQQVIIVLKILQGNATGNEVCSETFNPTTNEFGLVNLEIGSADPVAFSAIDWSNGPYFTQVELNGNIMGTTELLSVPYALYSDRSNSSYWEKLGPSIFYNGGNVGIGIDNPESKLHIKDDSASAPSNSRIILENSIGDKWFLNTWSSTNEFSIGRVGISNDILINDNGNVGIGTNDPNEKLDVHGNYGWHAGDNFKMSGEGEFSFDFDDGDGNDRWGVWDPVHGQILVVRNNDRVGIGTTNPTSKLDVRGNVTIRDESSGNIAVELGTGLDYAEGFDVSDMTDITPGTVLCIDPTNCGKLKISDTPYDRKVAGIVAGANNLGSGISLGADTHDFNVALAGRVYCYVDAGDETIEAGDLLTTSSIPGYAMKVINYKEAQGAVIGKAMESLEKGKKGQILVLVTLQ